MTDTLLDLSARELAARVRSGALSAAALTNAALDRIASREPNMQAWAYLDREIALRQADAADARHAAGLALGPLHGLPVGVKDIIDTADMPTEYNSALHRGRRPTADATVVRRLRSAGAIILGKTVTSEFAVYTPGPTRNPHDTSRTPGGSSSGSAAAVAANMVPLALATQTNGSTIRPASFCGIVGYKPSLGLLPRTGILKQSTMLDQPGLMARSVADVALMADALIGPDDTDEQSFQGSFEPLLPKASPSPYTPRFAFVRGPFWAQADRSTQSALMDLVARLGTAVETIELPRLFDDAAVVQGTLMNAGLAEVCCSDYARSRQLMSDILVGIVEAGQNISAVDFIAALSARDSLRAVYASLFADFDAIITPASIGIAPKHEDGTGNPIMATLWTLLGAPAMSLPLLHGPEGMPLGVQLVGRLYGDADLIRSAAWLECRHATS